MFKRSIVARIAFVVAFVGFSGCLVSYADSAPFGDLSAFNLVALGTTGPGAIAGNVYTGSDVEGRVAAANDIAGLGSVNSTLRGDPWGSLSGGYAAVAGNAITGGFNVNGNNGANVYAPTVSAGVSFNDGGHLVSTGPSPIDFAAERTAMQTLNANLSTLTANGTITGDSNNTELIGTSATLNVFTLTEQEFDGDALDFITDAGDADATIIVNVLGTTDTWTHNLLINGQQTSDSNDDNGLILFNFVDATSVSIGGQFDASILAPDATLTGGSQMGGNFIAAAIDQTGEVHNDEFTGTLPKFNTPAPTPEPGTLPLMGSGLLLLTGLLLRRRGAFARQ